MEQYDGLFHCYILKEAWYVKMCGSRYSNSACNLQLKWCRKFTAWYSIDNPENEVWLHNFYVKLSCNIYKKKVGEMKKA